MSKIITCPSCGQKNRVSDDVHNKIKCGKCDTVIYSANQKNTPNIKNVITIVALVGLALFFYLKNPLNKFKIEQLFASKSCSVTDTSLRTFKSYDNIRCENFDTYFFKNKQKLSEKSSREYLACLDESIQSLSYSGTPKSCKEKESATIDEQAEWNAYNQCKSDINTGKLLLLEASTNCNSETSFDYIVIDSWPENKVVATGQTISKGGTIKQIIHIGEYAVGSYKILFK